MKGLPTGLRAGGFGRDRPPSVEPRGSSLRGSEGTGAAGQARSRIRRLTTTSAPSEAELRITGSQGTASTGFRSATWHASQGGGREGEGPTIDEQATSSKRKSTGTRYRIHIPLPRNGASPRVLVRVPSAPDSSRFADFLEQFNKSLSRLFYGTRCFSLSRVPVLVPGYQVKIVPVLLIRTGPMAP